MSGRLFRPTLGIDVVKFLVEGCAIEDRLGSCMYP